jgi:thiol-disulfide isomerase/thioredoxin
MSTQRIALFLFISVFLFIGNSVYASIIETQEGVCAPTTENSAPCSDETKSNTAPGPPAADKHKGPEPSRTVQREKSVIQGDTEPFAVYFFWGDGCPHCKEEKPFLNEMKKKYPRMNIIEREVWYNKENAAILTKWQGHSN